MDNSFFDGFSFVERLLDSNLAMGRWDAICPSRHNALYGAVEFLERCVRILLKAGLGPDEILVRVDSGHDAAEFIRKLEELGVHYLVKRNPRSENMMQLFDSIRSCEDAIAFNCLRAIGQKALPHEPRPKPSTEPPLRHRPRSVLLDFIKVGCKVVRHAGELLLKFGRNCHNFAIMKEIYANC